MAKKALSLLAIVTAIIAIPASSAAIQEEVVSHDTERFAFESGHFKVIGELRIPKGEGK